jgi:hypothetical protein
MKEVDNMYYDEDVRDYSFDEPDLQFLMMTTDDKRIELLKVRDWFYDSDYDEMDYRVSWKLLVDGKHYRIEEEDREKLIQIALILFEEDKEGTKAINEHINEMINEQRMLGEY